MRVHHPGHPCCEPRSAQVLLGAGADWALEDSDGLTALAYSSATGNMEARAAGCGTGFHFTAHSASDCGKLRKEDVSSERPNTQY